MSDPTHTSPSASSAVAGVLGRIRTTMHERALDQQDLAEAIGVSESVMSRIMNDQRKLSAAELGALADRLGVTTGYLLGRGTSSPRPFAMAARLGAMSTQLREGEQSPELEPVFARARTLLELRGVLDRIVEAPLRPEPVQVQPVKNWSFVRSGEGTAARVREALGLGGDPIEDLVGLAEDAFGVDVSVEPLPADLHGVFLTDGHDGSDRSRGVVGPRLAVMLVNSNDTHGRQRYTLAHELGHLVFGDAELYWADYRSGDHGSDVEEKRANSFAIALLAPADAVRTAWNDLGPQPAAESKDSEAAARGLRRVPSLGAREQWLAEAVCAVSLRFGLSVDSTINRCDNLHLLNPKDKAFLKRTSAFRLIEFAGRTAERERLETHVNVVAPPPGLTGQALFAYAEGMVGIGPLAQLWRSSDPEELRASLAEQGWRPTFG